jgi:hypothetical protein
MRRALVFGVVLGLVALALPLVARADDPACEWLAGDFHVHTVYSHDTYGGPDDDETGPDEFYTFGWTPGQQGAIAESRELDFIAITDHDNTHAYERRDEGYTGTETWASGWGRQDQIPGGDPLVWIPDYEANVSGGKHAQMHGATHTYPKAGPQQMADAIRADGGAFQINHPGDTGWHVYDGDKDGDGNQDYNEFTYKFPGFAPDALEIWNIGVWLYQPPFIATNDHEFPVSMYDDLLDQGFHIAATGGSDNHWRSTTAAQGVGQPTTWVCAEDRTAPAIIDGVLAGRTRISNQPPALMGPTATLFADSEGDGTFEALLGDTVEIGDETKLQAVIENAEGATLRLVMGPDKEPFETLIDNFNFTSTFDVPEGTKWIRAEVFYPDGIEARNQLQPLCDLSNQLFGSEPDTRNLYCENRLAMVAMTSPIYFQIAEPEFDGTTTLTYSGDATGRIGRSVTLAATLVDSSGAALAGQPVTFNFRDVVYSATTDAAGLATVTTAKMKQPAGSFDVVSSFSGNDTYDASADVDPVAITKGNG